MRVSTIVTAYPGENIEEVAKHALEMDVDFVMFNGTAIELLRYDNVADVIARYYKQREK